MADPAFPADVHLPEGYAVQRELGRGGMATVYLARDLKHGRQVAVKIMRPELAMVLGAERFHREIQLAARLQHPHILPVFDSGESGGRLWYAMPFVEGQSLRARLDREGPLMVEEALQIAREVADALGYAHAQGIVHRDIKPENILFSNGHALVADFGIARVMDDAGGERLTETGAGVGTPEYMSPEQSLGERKVDGRSDLYTLAAVLYEMLAGEPPFTGPNAQAILAKRLTQPVPRVRTLRETVPEYVEAALVRALARAPADRFGDTGEFVAAFSTPTPVPPPAAATVGRRLVVLALALPGAAAVVWYLSQPRPAVPLAASVIAVIPFAPAESDTGLSRLGRDLASTVSASLDGIGEFRTVDRLTVLAQAREGSPALSLVEAAVLGRRLRATSVVHGTLAREGARVRLDAGLYSSDSLAPLARIEVRAPPESLSAITDSVTRELLEDIWRRGRPPTPTLEAALATRSVRALREYLDGERHLVAGQYLLARGAYGRAIAADSSFWFAYYRYGNAMGWAEGDVDSATEYAYRTHRQSFPERERLMIEASRADSGLRRQRAQLQEIVRRWPDYWPAWWILGDNLWHIYPQIGAGLADARKALEHVVDLNPSMVYAWQHLGSVYAEERDSAGLVRALGALERLNARATFIQNEQFDHVLSLETALALLRGRPAPDVMLDSLYQGIVAANLNPFLPSYYLLFQGQGALQIRLNRRLLSHGLRPEDARTTSEAVVLAWALRGAWDSALAARARFTPSPDDTLWALTTYRLAVLGAWVGGLAVREATRYRPAAVRLATARGPGYRAELAWLDGVLAAAGNDRAGLAAARRTVAASGAKWAVILDRSLTAFQAALGGDRRTAGRSMATLESELADSTPWFMYRRASPHLLLRGVDRMAAAEWLLASGDSGEAAPLLTWHEAASGPFEDKFALAPLAYLLRARIADGHGDTAGARWNYEQFLVRYDAPGPVLRHLVVEARDAMARLAGAPEPPAEP